MINKHKIMVLGAGSWGTALAIHLAKHHSDVLLWGRNEDAMSTLSDKRVNERYLPDTAFPSSLLITSDLSKIRDCDLILLVVPSHGFSVLLGAITKYLSHCPKIIWAIKGFDDAQLLSDRFEEKFPAQPYSVLAGPSFAKEVAKGLPTAVTIAGSESSFTESIAAIFHQGSFRVYTSDDVTGAELGGAVKNVIAIAAGIADGLGFGSNAIAALITRGLHEITMLGLAAGAKRETFMGLSGMGDLVLTCTDNQSRNRRFGVLIGKGKKVTDAVEEIGQTIEGLSAIEQLPIYAHRYDIDMPITKTTVSIINGSISAKEGVSLLLERTAKTE